MKIHVIGTRGWSYAGMEDLVRELGPRFVHDGDAVTIHAWATAETRAAGIREDVQNGVRRIFHTPGKGKYSGQFVVAIKSAWSAARSDCDVIYCAFIQNGIYMWLPRLFGKHILSNVDGIMWKDPKWPSGFRQLFFPLGAYTTVLFSNRTITDSYHMQQLYRNKFGLDMDWVGYGCSEEVPAKEHIELCDRYPDGYYLIMSRMTPHNLTDLMVDGFIRSGSKKHLVLAGHTAESEWFRALKSRSEGHAVTFLGLVRDQALLTQIILNARAYLHGHSLGGINPALVRVVGLGKPVLCIDTLFNREVVEAPAGKLQAITFQRNSDDVARAIGQFEADEARYMLDSSELGKTIRREMSWQRIYEQYRRQIELCLQG